MKQLIKIFLIISLIFINSSAGLFKNLKRASAYYAAKKAGKHLTKKAMKRYLINKYAQKKLLKKQMIKNKSNNISKVKEYKKENSKNYSKSFKQKHKTLNKKEYDLLKEKYNNKTITKEEYKSFNWNKNMITKRELAVKEFWKNEKQLILSGKKGTRNWSIKQKNEIINDKRPKYNDIVMQGHHKYSVKNYPQQAENLKNIHPTTKKEHLSRWHDGNFKNQSDGKPLNLNIKEEF